MRSYGITNAAPWPSAPPVGAPGDTYYDTTAKALYVSDGSAWYPVAGSGGSGGGSVLMGTSTAAGPFGVAATSFAAATNFAGISLTITPVSGHYYRVKAIIPQVTGGVTGNAVYLQLARDNAAVGLAFGYHAYLTGVMRTFAPLVEYVGILSNPGVATTFTVRGWSTTASSGSVACEASQNVFMTIEDLGPLGGGVVAGNPGLPPGGALGQALVKNSSTDYDVSWGGVAPLGLIGYRSVTDGATRTASAFSAAPDQGAMTGIQVVANRRYRVRFVIPGLGASFTTGNGAALGAISANNGTQLSDTFTARGGVTGFSVPLTPEWVGSLTAGTYSFAWRIWCGANVNSVVTVGNIIGTVEDLGALV